MTEFEESAYSVEGLTDFKSCKLPSWFSKRFYDLFEVDDGDEAIDFPFVVDFIQCPWLGSWGSALIDGQEVVLLEPCGADLELKKPAHIAERLRCGFHVVASGEPFRERTPTH